MYGGLEGMRDESLICVWNGDNSFLGFGSYEIPPLRMLDSLWMWDCWSMFCRKDRGCCFNSIESILDIVWCVEVL